MIQDPVHVMAHSGIDPRQNTEAAALGSIGHNPTLHVAGPRATHYPRVQQGAPRVPSARVLILDTTGAYLSVVDARRTGNWRKNDFIVVSLTVGSYSLRYLHLLPRYSLPPVCQNQDYNLCYFISREQWSFACICFAVRTVRVMTIATIFFFFCVEFHVTFYVFIL